MKISLLFLIQFCLFVDGINNNNKNRKNDNHHQQYKETTNNINNETNNYLNNRPCLISQEGWDGYGHQLEGKLSCMIVSYIDPRVSYIHNTFNKFEHSDLLPNKSESFLNIFNRYTLKSKLIAQKEINLEERRLNDEAPDFWLNMVKNNSDYLCNKSVIYSFDNCWVYIYHKNIVNKLYENKTLDIIRKDYYANSKPKPFFDLNRFNIVIHIRRCDAGRRILDKSFYISAINYFNTTYKSLVDEGNPKGDSLPVFWIESDDPNWSYIEQLKHNHPNQVNVNGKVKELLLAFHRMVMCDGFVMSLSSLSFAAMLLNGNVKKIVAPNMFTFSQDKQVQNCYCNYYINNNV